MPKRTVNISDTAKWLFPTEALGLYVRPSTANREALPFDANRRPVFLGPNSRSGSVAPVRLGEKLTLEPHSAAANTAAF